MKVWTCIVVLFVSFTMLMAQAKSPEEVEALLEKARQRTAKSKARAATQPKTQPATKPKSVVTHPAAEPTAGENPGLKYPYANENWNRPVRFNRFELYCALKNFRGRRKVWRPSGRHPPLPLQITRLIVTPTTERIEVEAHLPVSLLVYVKRHRLKPYRTAQARKEAYYQICAKVKDMVLGDRLPGALIGKDWDELTRNRRYWPIHVRLIHAGVGPAPGRLLFKQAWVWDEHVQKIVPEQDRVDNDK